MQHELCKAESCVQTPQGDKGAAQAAFALSDAEWDDDMAQFLGQTAVVIESDETSTSMRCVLLPMPRCLHAISRVLTWPTPLACLLVCGPGTAEASSTGNLHLAAFSSCLRTVNASV